MNRCNMNTSKKGMMERDSRIDLLRFVGILALILAHCTPPWFILEIRTFDVVLMVFLSGISFGYGKKLRYAQHIKRRFFRLIIPAELYLIAYFVFFNILKYALNINEIYFTKKVYVGSFTLVSGIGLVWIFRVLFLMAIIGPFLRLVIEKVGVTKYLILLIPYYLVLEVLTNFITGTDSLIFLVLNYFFLYMTGYAGIYGVGITISKLTTKKICVLWIICCIMFITCLIHNREQSINDFKYPTRLYYLLYGLQFSLLLWQFSCLNCINKLGGYKCIQWVSKNSLVIYLWHSVPLRFLEYGIVKIPIDNFITRYMFILFVALFLTAVYLTAKKYFMSLYMAGNYS